MDLGQFIIQNFHEFLTYTAFANATVGNLIMIAVGAFFIWLAIKKDFEPLLLVPIGLGIILGNIPFRADAGLGNYSSAALEGLGNYSNAALEGMGNYTAAALEGMGVKLRKGSPEAKARMAYLRSLRGKKQMKKTRGKGLLKNSLGFWNNYVNDWQTQRKQQLDEIKRLRELKKQKGGKFEIQDLRDGLLGPLGWINMGLRKKRQREIDALKNELNLN